GHTVFHATQPARVGGEVAADGAPVVTGGVRWVEQAVLLHRITEVQVDHPGLHHGDPVVRVDFHDLVEFAGHKYDPTFDDVRRVGQPAARATRYDRHLGRRARTHCGLHPRHVSR